MLKLLLICILFFTFSVQLLTGQDEPKRSITELNTHLKKSKSDSERVNLLLEAALVYVRKPGMERNDFNSAQFFVNQAINLSKSLNEPGLQAPLFLCVFTIVS